MLEFALNLFGSSTWEPQGHSFAWSQPLLGIMVISNLLIGLTFLLMGIVLTHLIRRRTDLAHRRMFMLFGLFIFGCGIGYFVRLWTIYEPVYRLQGWVDGATAAASMGTLILLLPILPAVYGLPSPSVLHSANEQLDREIQIRRQAALDLQQTTELLEFRVQERTLELERINAALKAQIDERIAIENALSLAHETANREGRRLKAIIEQVPSGLTIREASGALVMFSAATPEILGHELSLSTDFTNYRNFGAVHQDGTRYSSSEYPVSRALQGEKVVQEEMIYQRGDGSLTLLSVNASPLRDEVGAIIGTISTFIDISEQKRAEEAQALLASLVESTEDSIVGKDLKGMIISWNKGAERIYGYTPEEAIGKPILLIFPPDRAAEEEMILERIRRGEAITDFETDRKRADGSIIHVSLTVSPVRDVTGRIVGASAITRDVTTRVEQARRHQELLRLEQQARIAAEEASALKSEFLGMVSHELRTPLTSIMGFASTLLAEDVSFEPEVQRDFINIINAESGKLKDLVEQLLDVTRIQAKTLRIQPRPQPLQNAMEVAEVQLYTLAQSHELEINVPDDLPLVYADEKRIGQVIVNLVENAAKFSPSGTHIKITAAANGHDEVQIMVADEGIGISAEHHDWVFEPFRQVGEQFTSRGAGLGLAICKGLVEAHGGRIWVENRAKRGTTVIFTLSVAE